MERTSTISASPSYNDLIESTMSNATTTTNTITTSSNNNSSLDIDKSTNAHIEAETMSAIAMNGSLTVPSTQQSPLNHLTRIEHPQQEEHQEAAASHATRGATATSPCFLSQSSLSSNHLPYRDTTTLAPSNQTIHATESNPSLPTLFLGTTPSTTTPSTNTVESTTIALNTLTIASPSSTPGTCIDHTLKRPMTSYSKSRNHHNNTNDPQLNLSIDSNDKEDHSSSSGSGNSSRTTNMTNTLHQDNTTILMQTPPPPPPALLPQSHNRPSLFLTDYITDNNQNQQPQTYMETTTTPPLPPIQSQMFIDSKCHESYNGHENDETLSSLQQPYFDSTPSSPSTHPRCNYQKSLHSYSTIPPPKPSRFHTTNNPITPAYETSVSSVPSVLFTSVPLDALHSIAGYLTPQEWFHVGLVSKDALIACREVLKKVKMHGFKCALEVIASWELGQHADARELAALYLKSGVPIYPAPYGHEYHTIIWRMKLELENMQQHTDTTTSDATTPDSIRSSIHNHGNTNTTTPHQDNNDGDTPVDNVPYIDRFYPEYFDTPQLNSPNRRVSRSELYDSNLTYLEEKGIFWTNEHYKSKGMDVPSIPSFLLNRSSPASSSSRRLSSRRNRRFPHPPALTNHFPPDTEFFALYDEEGDAFHLDNILEQGRMVGISDNVVVDPGNNEHLLHFDFGRRAVQEDEDRSIRRRRMFPPTTASNYDGSNDRNYGIVRGVKTVVKCHKHLYHQHLQRHRAVYNQKGGVGASELSLSVDFFHPNESRVHTARNFRTHSSSRIPLIDEGGDFSSEHEDCNESEQRIESFWDLQMYCFQSEFNGKKNKCIKQHIFKTRASNVPLCQKQHLSMIEVVEQYEKRLSYLLERCDYAAFDECILDFWDEFFPITATIHFYDKYSPVPRSSYMRRFLSRPCPEAFGTVQCEIERIKVYNKSKGVNMAGRLFPTYEYRLFIRDRGHHPTAQLENPTSVNDDNQPRMDTILMTAKHKSRNQQTSGGKLSSNRKGVNNYLFYMPQEEDINNHLDAVNGAVKLGPYKQSEVPGAQFELGRLQSNFIGTEFQIFGPSSSNSKNCGMDDSANPVENSTPSTTTHSRGKAGQNMFGFPRRMRRQNNENGTDGSNDHNRNRKGRISPWSSFSKKAVNSDNFGETEQNLVMDKELGAITYTANLLGNRPRVMDVCVPKLSSETGLAIPFESSSENYDEGSILGNLKRLSHQLLHIAPQQARENDAVTTDLDNLGLMSLQNRPPWWNVELGAFVLNFGGRVSVASVKNFQLCDRNDHENIMLQFGRIEGRHSFTMDFSYPLSPIQAFAIAVSSLQSRISFA